jgi:hypothetical protein
LLTDGARREHRIALAATASDELPRGSVIKVFAELDHVSQSQVVIVANVLNLNPVKKP